MRAWLRNYLRVVGAGGGDPALDGVRGIAILLVVAFHVAESFAPPGSRLVPLGGWDAATPLLNGWMGVQLFFVLSGFLITHHLLRRWVFPVGWPQLRVYLAKRWIRIVPLYCLVLFTVALGAVPHFPVEPGYMGFRIAYHLLFLQDYLPSSILGPMWSLGVEEKFYLFVPLVLLAASRLVRRVRIVALLLVMATLPLVFRLAMVISSGGPGARSFTEVWRDPFHLNLDSLLLGALCAFVYSWRGDMAPASRSALSRGARWLGGGGILALLCVSRLLPEATLFDRLFVFPLIAVAASAWILGVALRDAGSRSWLEQSWLVTAGRLAYPWYLTHLLVMFWAWGELTSAVPGVRALSPLGQFGALLLPYVGGSFAVALLLHYLVEKPCLLWKDRIGRAPARGLPAGQAPLEKVPIRA